jgi:hypothetical protein
VGAVPEREVDPTDVSHEGHEEIEAHEEEFELVVIFDSFVAFV